MAEQTSPEWTTSNRPSSGTSTSSSSTHPAATGLALFAACMMMLIGVFHVLAGLVAIFDDNFFVVTRNYTYEFDTTNWGWIHLVSGIIVVAAAFGIFVGQTWARVLGIIIVGLSAVENFFFIPYYPIWSVLIIALDVAVIWALTVYGTTSFGRAKHS